MPNSRRSPASVLLLAVAAVFPSACAQADPPADDTAPPTVTQVTAALDARLDELEADGMAGVVMLWIAGEPVYERGLGHADCALTEPMTPGHVFLIGSITKEFMKVLGYALQADGALSFDDAVGAHLHDLPEHLAGLTVRQLLLHTAGLPDIIDREGRPIDYTVSYDYEPVERGEFLRRFGRVELIFEPGAREEYSNLGFQALAAIYENATGESVESLLRTRVFEPAGMTSTGWVQTDWTGAEFAEGCLADGSRWGTPLADDMWLEDGPSWNLRGAGGLLGTAGDLGRFIGALGDGSLLPPDAQAAYLKERLRVSNRYDERAMGPGGSNGIFDAFFYWLEESDFRLVVITSRENFIGEDYGGELIRLTAPAR